MINIYFIISIICFILSIVFLFICLATQYDGTKTFPATNREDCNKSFDKLNCGYWYMNKCYYGNNILAGCLPPDTTNYNRFIILLRMYFLFLFLFVVFLIIGIVKKVFKK